MASLYSDPYTELSDVDTPVMVMASKNGIWETVWSILYKKPYLVNSIPKERAWGILHQAVWWKNIYAVEKILQIPGCDSELLTKNGVRPLDIETTIGIKQLLKKHIDSNELSKASFFLSPEELAEPSDEIPCHMSDEELDEKEPQMCKEIHEASKTRNWKKMFKILKFWGHLINLVNPDTGYAPIHEAAIAGNDNAVIELMSYTVCDPLVETKKPAKVGKIAAQITKCRAVKSAILWKLNELKKQYTTAPSCVDPRTAQLNLMCYVHGAIKNNKISDRTYNAIYFRSFPDMEAKIFNFIYEGNNWELAKDSVVKEIRRIDSAKSEVIGKTNDKTKFFQSLIRLYTSGYYSRLNSRLRKHPIKLPDAVTESRSNSYRVYTALTNALLFHGDFDYLGKQCTQKTYRIMTLNDIDLQQYSKVGYKFSWLTFTSSSIHKAAALNFNGNCLFIINNKTKCQWSPRGIEKLSNFPKEREYLYPCGVYFEVTKFEKQVDSNSKHRIYLKLADLPRVIQPVELIYEQEKLNYDNLVMKYRNVYKPIIAQRELVDKANEKLHEFHLEMERNKNYENEVVAERKVSRINLPKGKMAHHCRHCNTTCDYPCPESHMYLIGKCEFCVPSAEGACTKCPGKCHFGRHVRTNYIIKEELEMRTVIDTHMKTQYIAAEADYNNQDVEYQNKKSNWETNFHKFPESTHLIKEMQESTQRLSNILDVNEDNTWDNWDESIIQFGECKSFVEECRFEMSQLGLM